MPLAKPEDFVETLSERVPVSGRSLVGVLATATAAAPQGEGLVSGRFTLPGFVRGPVCVQARTEDGRYRAENTYGTASLPGGVHDLWWSNVHKDELATMQLQQIAAITTLGACGSGGAGPVVPTGLGGAGGGYLQILVNTRGAVTWAVLRDPVAGGPALARARCVRLPGDGRVAFDARCVLGKLTAHDPLELRLEQEGRDGLSMEVVAKTTLRLDAPP